MSAWSRLMAIAFLLLSASEARAHPRWGRAPCSAPVYYPVSSPAPCYYATPVVYWYPAVPAVVTRSPYNRPVIATQEPPFDPSNPPLEKGFDRPPPEDEKLGPEG